jgi:deoxyribose-phosphate aldolase
MAADPLAQRIEHTLLTPEARSADYQRLVQEALDAGCAAVCVPSRWVAPVRSWATGLRVVSVLGFPSGAVLTEAKAAEAKGVVARGADELDMVADLGGVRDRDRTAVREDIEAVVAAGRPVKVIVETGRLSVADWTWAAEVAIEACAHYVKTCTGFGPGAARVEDIRRLRQIVKDRGGVKASGGIRDRAQAEALVAAGADRIGTSRGPVLLARPL